MQVTAERDGFGQCGDFCPLSVPGGTWGLRYSLGEWCGTDPPGLGEGAADLRRIPSLLPPFVDLKLDAQRSGDLSHRNPGETPIGAENNAWRLVLKTPEHQVGTAPLEDSIKQLGGVPAKGSSPILVTAREIEAVKPENLRPIQDWLGDLLGQPSLSRLDRMDARPRLHGQLRLAHAELGPECGERPSSSDRLPHRTPLER